MKGSQLLFRAGLAILIASIVSFSSAVIFFDYSGYETGMDRAFLVAVPTLAISFLLFITSPAVWNWARRRRPSILVALGALATLGATAVVLPVAVSPVYYLGAASLAIALFAVILPAAPFVERMLMGRSLWYYLLGFLVAIVFSHGAVGFLSTALETAGNALVFTLALVSVGSALGYYLVRRAVHSLRGGFLRDPLNVLPILVLPLFLLTIIAVGMIFPSVLLREHLAVPAGWLGQFVAGALVSGVWSIGLLEQFELRGLRERIKATKLFRFINENLPGAYSGGMFFLINLAIARALNHPALSVNTVLYESDAGPWMSILGSPGGDAVNRSVHPLVLTTARSLVRLAAVFLGDQWTLAPILVVAALSGLCVFMVWLFVKRATGARGYAFIFSILLGSTSAHLFFGSLTDTYVFGVTSLIFFWLLIQAGENRFWALVPAGVIVFGVTVTNIAQGVIGLFFNKFGFRRLAHLCIYILAAGIALTAFTSMVYPRWQTFFFVPADLSFETNFVKPVYETPAESLAARFKLVSRTMVLYGIVGPRPVEVVADKPPHPTIDLKTFEPSTNVYASYKGLSNIPLAMWLILLAGAFFFFLKDLRSSKHTPILLGLLGSLAFNFVLHMNYGTELFLYALYWTYLFVFFVALAFSSFAGKKWFGVVLILFMLALMANNAWFIFVTLRGLAPFFAAA